MSVIRLDVEVPLEALTKSGHVSREVLSPLVPWPPIGKEGVSQHYHLHTALTDDLQQYLVTSLPKTGESRFLETLHDTTSLARPFKWLIERHDLDTGRTKFILREVTSIQVDLPGFHALNWEQTTDIEEITARLGKHPIGFPRAAFWETTRHHHGEMCWLDYVNWSDRGLFGAYVVATFESPTLPLFSFLRDHWIPCASKYVAVLYALQSPLLPQCLSSDAYKRNLHLLQLHRPHDGKNGKASLTYAGFPDKPMNIRELEAKRADPSKIRIPLPELDKWLDDGNEEEDVSQGFEEEDGGPDPVLTEHLEFIEKLAETRAFPWS